MNAQEAMNRIAIGRLRRALQQGTISPDELQRRLSRAIDREMQKGARRMDTRFISACEDLLWQLNAPATENIPSGKREAWFRLQQARVDRGEKTPLRYRLRTAALALSLLLVVGGGLWMMTRRPPRERIHTSLNGQQTADPGGLSPSPAPTSAPLPTASPTPTPTPAPTPTLTPTLAPTITPQLTPVRTQQPAGREKYRDIQALRGEAPARWRGSYTDALGRQVEVDVPIQIPDVKDVPALRLKWIDLASQARDKDTALYQALRARYGEKIELGAGWIGDLHLDVNDRDHVYFYGPRNKYADVAVYPDTPPAKNDMPEERPFALLKELLSLMDLPADEMRLDAQAGTSGFYYSRVLRSGEQAPDVPFPHIDQSKPAEGYERGYYRLSAMQVMRGLPLFPGDYINTHGLKEPRDVRVFARMNVLDEQDFSLDLRMARETGVKERDLPLMNMEAVIGHVEELITRGLLRRVDSLELGYMLYYAEHVDASAQSVEDELIALPVWRVRGILLSFAEEEMKESYFGGADSYRTDLREHELYELRFSAQTGEYIDPDHQGIANPPILTWEQMDDTKKDVRLF